MQEEKKNQIVQADFKILFTFILKTQMILKRIKIIEKLIQKYIHTGTLY